METLGLVLAGGNSSRMGQDKALLPVGDHTLAEHIYCLMKERLDHVWISRQKDQPLPFAADRVVFDKSRDKGPLSGISAALKAALKSDQYEGLLIIPVDMPRLTDETLMALLQEGRRLQRPVCYGKHYIPLYLPVSSAISDFISDQLNDPGSRRSVASVFYQFDGLQLAEPHNDSLTNTNTMAEWQAVQETPKTNGQAYDNAE